MFYGLLAAITITALIYRWFVSANKEKRSKFIKYAGIFAAFILAFILLRAGLPLIGAAIATIAAISPYLNRFLQIFHIVNAVKKKNKSSPPVKNHVMTRQEALDILGLKEGATEEDIKNAYQSLMKKIHPDTGGSKYLASQINTARDTLIKH